jgi:sulfur relay (sulfurtransferase) complex TusBCD TusD component (DsrE family)
LREEKTGSGLPAPTTPAPGLGAVANNNPTALVASPTTMMTSPQPSKLFVNLTSDEPWRAAMALRFARIYQERGILATVFLNVEGVNVATRNVTETQLQPAAEELKSFQQKGGQVLVCQPCLKKYGLQTTDLTPGLLMATPDNVSASLFDPATRVMSW